MKSPLHTNSKFTSPESRHSVIAEILSKNYISIAEVDLYTGNAVVLKSDLDHELEGIELPWSALIDRYVQRRVCQEDKNKVLSLTQDYLETFLDKQCKEHSLEVRCISENKKYIWVQITLNVISSINKKLLVTTHSIDEDRMLKNIVDLFVYQNFEYFILLDAKNNCYTTFSSKKGCAPPPPPSQDDYTKEMISYNKRYVVPEEIAQVNANMQIPHIIKMLEKDDKYSFTSGIINDQGDYHRARVQFQYYDKSMGLILVTRADVTQIFMEEQAKNQRLNAALRDAQHDALTGIYNQKAICELVSSSLESQYRSSAALLFIDIDNFKMINDTLGHQKGDELLRFLSNSILHTGGRAGIAGRIGGDEFLLFLPIITSINDIKCYAKQICGMFDSISDDTIKNLPISCSVGISIYPKDGTDYETLVRKADQALYTSKRYGKNQYYFYSQEI